jgi:hypothetical protein
MRYLYYTQSLLVGLAFLLSGLVRTLGALFAIIHYADLIHFVKVDSRYGQRRINWQQDVIGETLKWLKLNMHMLLPPQALGRLN